MAKLHELWSNGWGALARTILGGIVGGLILLNLAQFKEALIEKCDRIERNITEIKVDFKEYTQERASIIRYYEQEWAKIRERVTRVESKIR